MSDVTLSRVMESSARSDEMAATIMLYSLARLGLEEKAEALAVCPGMGEYWRGNDVISTWERGRGKHNYLLIAGHNQAEKTWADLSVENLQKPPVGLRRTEGVHVDMRPEGGNGTNLQARWLLKKAQELDISSMALFVSPYHLLRAYCTVLSAFLKAGREIFLIPAPVVVSPDRIIPESGADAWASVAGELVRMDKYQVVGDVATYQELKDYISWFWAHCPLDKRW